MKKIYEETVLVPKNVADEIDGYLEKGGLGEDETITYTAKFPDGMEMDIKCCGVQDEDPDFPERAWTEAVLFTREGFEVCFTEAEEEYFGEWELEKDDTAYRAVVKRERD